MYDPLTALMWGIAFLAVTGIIFWPRYGLYARYLKVRQGTIRILIEDALKHLYECERNQISCSYKSLAGALSISQEKASRIIKQLEGSGLVNFEKTGFALTQEGRNYALRMIRIHRLWEHFLAEYTGVPETSWHMEADIHEHHISTDQAEEISLLLGNPRYDPHGDPIPSATGHIPPKRGVPVTDLADEDAAEIVHIEDEPREIYADIIDRGLHTGMQLIRIGENAEGTIFKVEGRSIVIPHVLLQNISVRKKAPKVKSAARYDSLDILDMGEAGEVVELSKACKGYQRRRLMDLGILPGAVITPEIESLGADPRAYRVRGALIALRKEQAKYIFIRKMKEVA